MARIYDKGVFGCGGMPRISRIDSGEADLERNEAGSSSRTRRETATRHHSPQL